MLEHPDLTTMHIMHAGLDPFTLLIVAAIGLAAVAVGYLLMPTPKREKPAAATDLESPTADAGRPIPVVMGTVTLKGPNILWWGDKDVYQYEIDT